MSARCLGAARRVGRSIIFQLAETLQPALPQKSAGTTSLRNEMSARCLGAARRVGRQIRSRAKFNPQVLFIWGSLAHTSEFQSRSDIVCGLLFASRTFSLVVSHR